jgi:PAS domain S-box-containing protein
VSAPVEEVFARFDLRAEDGSAFPTEALPGRRVLHGEPTAEALIRVREHRTGDDMWRLVRSTPMREENGEIRFVVNVFHDVTQQKRTEDELRFRTLLLEAESEASDEGIFVSDISGAVVSWNRRLLAVLGLREDEVAGRSREEVYESMRPRLANADDVIEHARRLWSRPTEESREEFAFTDGHIVQRFSRPLRDERGRFYGRVSFFRDVTDDRKHERQQRFLAESSRELVSSLDYETVLQRVAALAVPELADWCAVDVVEPDGSIRLIAVAHVEPAKAQWAFELRKRFPIDPAATQGVANVIRTGASEHRPFVTVEQMQDLAGDDPELREIVHQLRITSYMLVPLIARGRTLGAMTFVWAETGRSYSEDDLVLAEDLAGRAALALDNARLYHERDQVAQTLQQSLLPGPLPAIEGLRVAARYHAAGEGIEVGGDFFDVFDVGGGAHAFVIGDVCGKGPKAAALMGAARHTIRTAAMAERKPSDVLRVLNAALHQRLADQWFCTVAYVRARRAADGVRLTICCAGHPLPVIVRVDGSVEVAGRPGTLVGVFPDVELVDVVADLRPGDTFVLYTDGVTDQQRDGEAFGLERLSDVLRRTAGRDADEVAQAIEEAVASFRPQPPGDDIALVVTKVVDA